MCIIFCEEKSMNDRYFMELAYKNAKKAYKMDESPIGAVIVRGNEVISCGYNKKNKKCTFVDEKNNQFDKSVSIKW